MLDLSNVIDGRRESWLRYFLEMGLEGNNFDLDILNFLLMTLGCAESSQVDKYES